MVVLNLYLDNFLVFRDFSLNLSFPKKPVNSVIEDEHLAGRRNFRYKKLIVLMGANATGKTALGTIIRGIFNFIARKEYTAITELIEDPTKDASFSIDLAFSDYHLYRITAIFHGRESKEQEFNSDSIDVQIKSEPILARDSYEMCASRLDEITPQQYDSYIQALESVPFLTWLFEAPFANTGKQRELDPVEPDTYTAVLEKTLQALDPRVLGVLRFPGTEKTFVIRYTNHFVFIKDGLVVEPEKLSSGTAEGIGIANLMTAMKLKVIDFFYCDEKFSHVHSTAEKAFLSLLIETLGPNQQLFFTTHNSDILDMNIPFHSYAFLRRDEFNDNAVSCVFASDYIKKNTQSLKNAVENDLFLAAPDTDRIFGIFD